MSRFRTSLDWIMLAVALVALDLALLGSFGGRDDLSIIRLTVFVLVGDILTLGFFGILKHRGQPHPFLVGFEVTGLATLALFLLLPGLGSGAIAAIQSRLLRLFWHPLSDYEPGDPLGRLLVFVIWILVPAFLLSTPVIIAALIGGWLRLRYRND